MQIETIEEIKEAKNELAIAGEKINTGLAAFDKKKADLEALAQSAAEITINGIEDKEGYKLADAKRKELKKERVAITNEGKEMRSILTQVGKGIIEKEKELTSIIEGEEQRLVDEQNKIDAEKERIKQEEIKRQEAIINDRINTLSGYGFQIDYSEIKAMDDATFNQYAEAAKVQFEKAEEERKETERLEAEKAEKERLEKEAEAKRLADERAELERLRAEAAEAQRVIDEANKARQAEIDAENKRIADEKAAIEAEKARIQKEKDDAEAAKRREQELKEAREKAAEEARLKAIQDAKDAEIAKKEAEQKAAEEAKIKADQAPDKIKINEYIKSIQEIDVPAMKSAKGKKTMAAIQELVGKLTDYSTQKASEL